MLLYIVTEKPREEFLLKFILSYLILSYLIHLNPVFLLPHVLLIFPYNL